MRETQREYHRVLPGFGAIAHAHDIEFSGEAVRHAAHSIGDKRPGQTVERPLWTAVILTDGEYLVVFLLKSNSRRNRVRDAAFRTCHHDRPVFDIDFDFVRNGNRFFTDSRHMSVVLLTSINIA